MLKPNETQAKSIEQLELPFGACKLLMVLRSCKPAEDGKIEAPRAYFAERIRVHVSTISRYTRKLAEQGYIHIDKATRVGKPNRYTLLSKQQKTEAPETKNETPLPVVNAATPVVEESFLDCRARGLPWIVGSRSDRKQLPAPTLDAFNERCERELSVAMEDPHAKIDQYPRRFSGFLNSILKGDLYNREALEVKVRYAYLQRIKGVTEARREAAFRAQAAYFRACDAKPDYRAAL